MTLKWHIEWMIKFFEMFQKYVSNNIVNATMKLWIKKKKTIQICVGIQVI